MCAGSDAMRMLTPILAKVHPQPPGHRLSDTLPAPVAALLSQAAWSMRGVIDGAREGNSVAMWSDRPVGALGMFGGTAVVRRGRSDGGVPVGPREPRWGATDLGLRVQIEDNADVAGMRADWRGEG